MFFVKNELIRSLEEEDDLGISRLRDQAEPLNPGIAPKPRLLDPSLDVSTHTQARSTMLSSRSVCVVVLIDVARPSRLWGYRQFLFGRYRLPSEPGLKFSKVLGSGYEAGFGLKPSASRQGLFCVFEDHRDARRFLTHSGFLASYRDHASELLTATLRPYSVRGSWSGYIPEISAPPPSAEETGEIAALTRASIKPSKVASFWHQAPPAEASLADAQGCSLAAGLGEAPVLRQATFSIWDSLKSMDAYARHGAHLAAIRASRNGDYFSESMFIRFRIDELKGSFKGQQFG